MGSYKHPEVQLFPQSLSELCVTSFSLEMQPVFLTRLPTHHESGKVCSTTSKKNHFPWSIHLMLGFSC